MQSLKVVAVLLLANLLQINCSVLAPAIAAPPAIGYSLVAPQNIRPFAAQVSTFTKGLNFLAAPYAAGVLGGPAIVPAPAAPAWAPGPAYAPAWAPAAYPAAPAPLYPAAPAAFLPPPFARSIHAVAPGLTPYGHPAPHAALLG